MYFHIQSIFFFFFISFLRYFLDQTESNVQRYLEHKEISAHEKIKELAKEADACISKL